MGRGEMGVYLSYHGWRVGEEVETLVCNEIAGRVTLISSTYSIGIEMSGIS